MTFTPMAVSVRGFFQDGKTYMPVLTIQSELAEWMAEFSCGERPAGCVIDYPHPIPVSVTAYESRLSLEVMDDDPRSVSREGQPFRLLEGEMRSCRIHYNNAAWGLNIEGQIPTIAGRGWRTLNLTSQDVLRHTSGPDLFVFGDQYRFPDNELIQVCWRALQSDRDLLARMLAHGYRLEQKFMSQAQLQVYLSVQREVELGAAGQPVSQNIVRPRL